MAATMTEPLKTPYQRAKEEREDKIYQDYIFLSSQPEAMKTAVYAKLMAKYKIHSRSTVWAIINRAEARAKTQN
jgi:Mor family transcriptional regulator